ncbi:carbohydrate ABC transporter permease [Mahella australiensis]|uniref:Binding-protein-dependent transport systems inner membrane component n=1 Tax=Mahella australiensis (strain DSM 15567 / CIP 107919 / 50-1 BON) TaxID=697281 RepID=F4A2J1_MAHA5|nr:carbohydrate ABC transporter permease [Mahella australiensis]AEE97257.1 binding-protein-dependent transport systems inner membrane component [Mahella australiensis 50-1 BON]
MALITDSEIKVPKYKGAYAIIIAILSIGIPIQIFPFIWLLSSSLKGIRDIFELPPRLIPKEFHFENYTQVFKLIPLGHYFYNTFLIAALTIAIQVSISILAAFALSKLKPKGSKYILLFFLATMMIPNEATMIPTYLVMRRFPITGWNLINTPWAVVLPWSAWAWAILLLKGFFDGLPDELFDAAKIDGASTMQVLISVMLPLSTPIIAIVVLQTFLAVYQQFAFPLIMMPDSKAWTITVAIYNMESSGNFGWHLIMVLLVYATIPMLIVFLFAQKYLVQGIKLTGIKG